MENKNRMQLIQHYLYDHTDIDHWASSKDIKSMLEAHGVSVVVRTIDSDVEQLIAGGHDITIQRVQGTYTHYKVNSRLFETAELKLLADAVSASQFIGAEKSISIIERLASIAPLRDRQFFHTQTTAKTHSGILATVDTLMKAICSGKQIAFHMCVYSANKEKSVSSKEYRFSPYDLIWVNDRYYLVGWDEKEKKIKNPRVDHICDIEITKKKKHEPPEEYDIASYYEEIYKACGGPMYDVTIQCSDRLAGKFIDRFGMDYLPIIGDGFFQATVPVAVSNTFFGWLFQYAGDMTIVGPQVVLDMYKEKLAKAMG